MRNMPAFVDGAVFGFLLVPLLLLLKMICPLSAGCFVDPFFIPLFSPIFVFESLATMFGRDVTLKGEIVFLILFWTVLWAVLAHMTRDWRIKEEH